MRHAPICSADEKRVLQMRGNVYVNIIYYYIIYNIAIYKLPK